MPNTGKFGKVRIEQWALTNLTEVFYHVVIQIGPKRDDDRDWLVALCFRRRDAAIIKRALEQMEARK